MKDLVIYGAGGLGREMAVLIEQINVEKKRYNLLGFFDDGIKKGSEVDDLQVMGGKEALLGWKKPLQVVMAIADPALRYRLVESMNNSRLTFPPLTHPSCIPGAEKRNRIGKGVILTANVVMTTHVRLDDFVIVNLATTIGHDVHLGKFTSVMPSCSISGNVKTGERCFIGTGARLLQNISIGDDCVIGAGAVVTKSFKAGSRLMGVPAVISE